MGTFIVTVTFDIEADSYGEAVEQAKDQVRALEEASVLTLDLQDIDLRYRA